MFLQALDAHKMDQLSIKGSLNPLKRACYLKYFVRAPPIAASSPPPPARLAAVLPVAGGPSLVLA